MHTYLQLNVPVRVQVLCPLPLDLNANSARTPQFKQGPQLIFSSCLRDEFGFGQIVDILVHIGRSDLFVGSCHRFATTVSPMPGRSRRTFRLQSPDSYLSYHLTCSLPNSTLGAIVQITPFSANRTSHSVDLPPEVICKHGARGGSSCRGLQF